MKRIIAKLRSREGASIVLALLFFLLCVMVGASVLAAASSNAGKAAERRREQQEYFAVSSALQLVCDRLEQMKYKANVSVSTASVSTHYTYTKTTYAQTPGTVIFDADTGVDEKWKTIFPGLQKELDSLFSERVTKEECNGYHGDGKFQDDDMHTHSALGGTDVSPPAEHTLNVEVNKAGLPVDALEELTKEVEIKVRLGKLGAGGYEKYWFFLEAKLVGGKGKFVVRAELKPKSDFPHINNSGTYNGPYPGLSEDRAGLQWELVRIYKVVD